MIYFNGIKNGNYFEGWFFRISQNDFNCALIPSVSVVRGCKKAYIQLNCNSTSTQLEFDYNDFFASDNEVVIGGNRFSTEGIKFCGGGLDLDVKFGEFTTLKKDIMGCFKFGTPCKHKIISMRHSVTGRAVLNEQQIELSNAVGYAEKDWGKSFPSGYCWLQSNDFSGTPAAFFFSAAKIGFPFLGLICSLIIDGKEYRFATYNFSKIKKLSRGEIILKKAALELHIVFNENQANALLAPVGGNMNRIIKENLNGEIKLRLYQKGELLYCLNGKNAGIEWAELC